MSSNIVGYVLAVGLLGSAAQAAVECPDSSGDRFIAESVRTLAEKLHQLHCPPPASGSHALAPASGSQDVARTSESQGSAAGEGSLEPMIAGLDACKADGGKESAAGDLTDALLLENYNVFSVVRDTILVCGQEGKGREVAALVASRALMVKGQGSRYLVDAGVLAAAAKMAERQREAGPAGTTQVAAAQTSGQRALAGGSSTGQPASSEAPTPAQRDPERERLERMMEKGLLTDEYKAYIDERRGYVEQSLVPGAPDIPNTYVYAPADIAIYGPLYEQALIGSGYLDHTLDQRADPGGFASVQ